MREFRPEDAAQLEALKAAGDWAGIVKLADQLRDNCGPVPAVLQQSGFASAQLADFPRAHRLMADALLSEFNPDWLPWLAAVYDKLGWALPMWPIARWLQVNQPDRNGVAALYERALNKIGHELERRGLAMPPAQPPAINLEMAHKYNVRMVECLRAGEEARAIEVGEGARLFYPNYQPLLINLSIAYKRLNRYEDAGKICLYSLALDPLGSGAISNFGSLLIAANSSHDAAWLLEAGAILFRDEASIWSNLAVSYNNMKVAPWEAELAARRAIELDKTLAASWSALAGSLCRQGRMAESLEASRIVGELEPRRKNESLFNLNYSETLSLAEIAAAHFEAAEARLGHHYREQCFGNTLDPGRRLRVGFVSGDLVGHPVAYFIEPVLELLPQHCEVYVYHNRPRAEEDAVSEQIQKYDLAWKNIFELTDDELHAEILSDAIDVLVDLSGHSAYHRLPVFAMRAAPVQVTYIGYPNTTGLKTMDYFLAHERSVSPGLQQYYAEKIVAFKSAASVYRPLVKSQSEIHSERYAVCETPAIKNGYVTFGTLNNIAKISDAVIACWADILNRVEGSKILIESPGFHQRDFTRNFSNRFAQFGIEASRVILKNRDPKLQYIRYNEIDIALDPFPFCGGTTTCDAVWMGIPLVSHYGPALMSRAGLTVLSMIGHPEWACASLDEYVNCAVDLASDVPRLNAIRLALRGEVEKSPLMDYDGFARDLSEAFRSMWREYVKTGGAA